MPYQGLTRIVISLIFIGFLASCKITPSTPDKVSSAWDLRLFWNQPTTQSGFLKRGDVLEVDLHDPQQQLDPQRHQVSLNAGAIELSLQPKSQRIWHGRLALTQSLYLPDEASILTIKSRGLAAQTLSLARLRIDTEHPIFKQTTLKVLPNQQLQLTWQRAQEHSPYQIEVWEKAKNQAPQRLHTLNGGQHQHQLPLNPKHQWQLRSQDPAGNTHQSAWLDLPQSAGCFQARANSRHSLCIQGEKVWFSPDRKLNSTWTNGQLSVSFGHERYGMTINEVWDLKYHPEQDAWVGSAERQSSLGGQGTLRRNDLLLQR